MFIAAIFIKIACFWLLTKLMIKNKRIFMKPAAVLWASSLCHSLVPHRYIEPLLKRNLLVSKDGYTSYTLNKGIT
jgi:hypothetical protein